VRRMFKDSMDAKRIKHLSLLDKITSDIDWTDLEALYAAVGWKRPFHKAQRLRKSFEKSYSFCLAYLDGRLVAAGRTLSDGQVHGWIHDVVVDPNFQKRGIGKAVIFKLIEQLAGVRYVALLCSPAGQKFYEKCGFKGGDFSDMTMRQKTR
jgi:GNAT superfamily N-acetyltransferase